MEGWTCGHLLGQAGSVFSPELVVRCPCCTAVRLSAFSSWTGLRGAGGTESSVYASCRDLKGGRAGTPVGHTCPAHVGEVGRRGADGLAVGWKHGPRSGSSGGWNLPPRWLRRTGQCVCRGFSRRLRRLPRSAPGMAFGQEDKDQASAVRPCSVGPALVLWAQCKPRTCFSELRFLLLWSLRGSQGEDP